ncbi:Rv3235 family protein [Streptomyces sp. CA-251387]|uniref:Rv3235 family protein n=1 Tax=Streptomyces sp. CA-251387 TaxID=3240064 RepID=UPI003D8AD472
MNKVMTRTQLRPGTRPQSRRDPRRPGGLPPRAPGGGTSRTASPGDRPPGSQAATGSHARTRPTDTRPPSAPARPRPITPPTTSAQPRSIAQPAGPAQPRPISPPAAPARPRPIAPTQAPSSRATGVAPVPKKGGTLSAPGCATHPRPAPSPDTPEAPASVPTHHPLRPIPQPRPTDVFADRLLLVLSGQRPVHSMLRHTAGRAYDELAWLAERSPLRTRGTRPVVRDIGYFEPRPGAVEAFARIGAGNQLRAMAFRLEQGQDLRWRCTAVELGGPRRPRTDDD